MKKETKEKIEEVLEFLDPPIRFVLAGLCVWLGAMLGGVITWFYFFENVGGKLLVYLPIIVFLGYLAAFASVYRGLKNIIEKYEPKWVDERMPIYLSFAIVTSMFLLGIGF